MVDFAAENGDTLACATQIASAMRQAHRNKLMTDAVWKELANDAGFEKVIAAIGGDDA